MIYNNMSWIVTMTINDLFPNSLNSLGSSFADQWLVGLLMFAFVSSITPGPNNVLLAASGARFGSRRTMAHAAGIWTGMVTLLVLAAAGFGALASTSPSLVLGLQMMAVMALLWTALGMLRAPVVTTASYSTSGEAAQPWSFWQGVGFQYLNPKALMMAVTAVAMTPLTNTLSFQLVALMIVTFMVVSIPCTWLWVLAGAALRSALSSPTRQRAFNIVMAVLLVATIPLSMFPSMVDL
jgi:threonine/homoserine/homoserine lactone efflux protein